MKKIGKDKWKHFYVGIFLGICFEGGLFFLFPLSAVGSIFLSFLIVSVIAFGFEAYSFFTGHGHCEINDALASILGGLIGIAVWLPFIF